MKNIFKSKKGIASIISIIAIVTVFSITASSAWFTSVAGTKTAGGAKAAILQIEQVGGTSNLFEGVDLVPGGAAVASVTPAIFKNTGTIPVVVAPSLKFGVDSDRWANVTPAKLTQAEFQVTYEKLNASGKAVGKKLDSGWLNFAQYQALVSNPQVSDYTAAGVDRNLAVGESIRVSASVRLKDDATNEYQNLHISAELNVQASQK